MKKVNGRNAMTTRPRADSPVLGFDSPSTDPLRFPSPDYIRNLSLDDNPYDKVA